MFALSLPVFAQEAPPVVSAGAEGKAVELGVNAGFAYGWGSFNTGVAGTTATAQPGVGGAIELEPAWRALPMLAVGAYGFGAQLTETAGIPSSGDVMQAGAGVEGTLHFLPSAPHYDPWLTLGTGWRGQWFAYEAGVATAQNGWDYVRARAGLDTRISPNVAIGPAVGASLSRYYAEEILGGPWTTVPNAAVNVYVFAGVRATLDYALHPPRP